ncbi:hypothetical protein LN042_35595 [Kitasatospora sp. RB6PN24]|nr:hypothetical protein [Kitasatospora humi]MCC9312325.1 hypothetical protein [Kitasatospora humi]
MAAECEEIVVDTDRRQAQDLGERLTQELLLRRRRCPPGASHVLGRRQRLAIQLAVHRQRQLLQQHDRRRHHVGRQPLTRELPEAGEEFIRVGADVGRNRVRHQALVAR